MDHQQAAQPPLHYFPVQDGVPEKAAPQFQYQQPVYEPYPAPSPNAAGAPAGTGATILSVTRRVALGVLAALVILLIAVIGLSAGLGVSQRDLHQAQSDLQLAQAALSSAIAVGSPTATSSLVPSSTSSAVPTQTAVADDVECPRVNGTVYTASTGGKRFRRMCGVDYSGTGQAVDIGNVQALNLEACIDACASRSNCTGAGWGVIQGDKGPNHTCWMKTNLSKSHTATSDWAFAVLLFTSNGK